MQTSLSSSSEKALILRIEFFEAHFKVHYTKGFRLTYPIPLPTSVAGIFASMLGIDGKEAAKKFKNCRFGSVLVKGKYNETIEYSTFLQYTKNRRIVVRTHIIVNPIYYIAMQCPNINKIQNDIVEGIEYLPFGGQNDFFAKDWSVIGMMDVYNSIQISNYLYSEQVQQLTKGVSLEILPVMHKFGGRELLVSISVIFGLYW